MSCRTSFLKIFDELAIEYKSIHEDNFGFILEYQ